MTDQARNLYILNILLKLQNDGKSNNIATNDQASNIQSIAQPHDHRENQSNGYETPQICGPAKQPEIEQTC
jgi:hypothetical protein